MNGKCNYMVLLVVAVSVRICSSAATYLGNVWKTSRYNISLEIELNFYYFSISISMYVFCFWLWKSLFSGIRWLNNAIYSIYCLMLCYEYFYLTFHFIFACDHLDSEFVSICICRYVEFNRWFMYMEVDCKCHALIAMPSQATNLAEQEAIDIRGPANYSTLPEAKHG